MFISRKWLSDFTNITASSQEYEDAMTMSGSKVEATVELSEEIQKVVVGRVLEIERVPDSDHLWVCRIDVGQDEPVQIVTGAQNVRENDMVPVALHKSTLPGGTKITKGKIRGVKSEGMLCSTIELNVDKSDFPYATTGEEGIFILQEECNPGDDIRPIIGADDSIVEFEITSNRPDCLSVIGLARESAVTFGTELNIPEPVVKGSGGDINELLSIEIKDPELCLRYTGRMIKNIKIEPSPKWMRQRLRAAGVRPINNIVDITNYVMLEYGQPMHAFDYACLDGGKIIVRTATKGETMNTLDGVTRALTTDMLLIADAKKPVGIAGVMGGENSEVTEDTQYVVFESANFKGVSIRKTAGALGMRTDASSKFEKGLDVENTLPAVQRACQLVELLGAGIVIDGIIDIRETPFKPTKLNLDAQKINKLLGTSIDESFMVQTLTKLGFDVVDGVVTVPSWRRDIEHFSDLAEEIARFYGYDVIEPTLHEGSADGGFTPKQIAERNVTSLCRALSYSEICTYSFVGQSDYDSIELPKDSPLRKGVTILNPLGEDTSIMRTTSLPSMMGALMRNWGHRNQVARLYEMATVYMGIGEKLPEERPILTLGAYGHCDFFEIKGACETILREMRVKEVRFAAEQNDPSYHPGRSAAVFSGETKLGIVGQVHPTVAKHFGVGEAYAAQIDLLKLLDCAAQERVYVPLPRFPAITRDIAVVCGMDVTAADLTNGIFKSGGKLLRDVKLFDVYTGDRVQAGKKSMAFSLTLRSDEQTLTDEHADEALKNILLALETQFGAVIR
ncbi:MAG: phenylalanine--tRNA ligase subunit beta [Oscillospiraceae bacterium]|nr:phenylalanine--tRNA ligase subunit beta [Oscillospiraceae bacterium]